MSSRQRYLATWVSPGRAKAMRSFARGAMQPLAVFLELCKDVLWMISTATRYLGLYSHD